MKHFALFANAVLAASHSMSPTDAQTELMNRIELDLQLPAGAMAINSYTRYYYYQSADTVFGTFVRGENGRKWVKSSLDTPHFKDGGCSIVNVRFDVPLKKITAVFCNGEA